MKITDPIYLSVVVPSYKSAGILEKNLPVLLSYFKMQDYTWEVIVVDDGSDDLGATEMVCNKLDCIFTRNERNMGKGAAVRNGMKKARGRFRIFTDADIPYNLDTIGVILEFLDQKEYDVVFGDRNLKDSAYFLKIPRLRKITSAFFTYFVGTIVTTSYFDTQCGLKGFRSEIADFIFQHSIVDGFAFDVELVYISLKRNYRIQRVPVRLRNQEKSSVRVLRDGMVMFFDLFKIKINNMRGQYR